MNDPTVFVPTPPVLLPVAGTSALFPVRHIHCIGRNYADHAREMGADPDREPPFFFAKAAQAAVGGTDTFSVPYPKATERLEHEVELVVALGPEGAPFGVAIGIDLTRRDLQALAKSKGRPWESAKSFTGAAPIGPIQPLDGRPVPVSGRIALSVNGMPRQDGNLDQMIWSVPEALGHLTAEDRLYAGDLLFTGTPAGVGPVQPGDVVGAEIEGLGGISVTIGDPHP
ncbi:fumarylacetoacetate hydrolase family protein [Magnetospira sp. QH-2]|uniref:fumarylacetoacetate hydrolase family protein n=1 Tax=Magnetospira sp. (strain QH-2) TaxID=1288970 RepID=UPI0003E818E6|nr:fumarylacetoacetate hydrolase family protein [Magnetospira sp. QH-2]CCQ74944.1 putative Fumarylpyruvate(FAA) hydrolase [Magnetospira sp. QH-2]